MICRLGIGGGIRTILVSLFSVFLNWAIEALWCVADILLAIWDNRSVYHTATPDYEGLGSRTGQRAVSLGERPYLDPNSKSRKEALGLAVGQNLPA